MVNNLLASEQFSTQKRHYFLDFKLAANRTNYIQITRSDEQADGSFKRNHIEVFEEDFAKLFQGPASLFQHAAYIGLDKLNFKQQSTMLSQKPVNGIKSWEPDMRPREKMLAHGASVLSDAELLALLIGSGTQKETAVDLSHRILKSLDYDLEKLSSADYKTMGGFPGMGLAKCSSIISAMELARRLVQLQLRSANVFLNEFEKEQGKSSR